MDFDFSTTTGWEGYKQRDLNICLIAFSTVIVGLRIYVRVFMTKGLGLDDVMTGIAYVCLVALSALEIRAVGLGSGAHMDEVPGYFLPLFFSALTTLQLMYFWCVGLTRMAIVCFLLRLSKDLATKVYRNCVYATGAVIVVQTIACFLYRLLECKNIADLWKMPGSAPCSSKDSEAIMMWTHGAIGIAVDVALIVLPISVVHSQMMSGAKMMRVILIFCIGIFACITGIVREALMVENNFAVDTTFKVAVVGFWTDLEGHVVLWCACFPALQPLVRLASYKFGFRSNMDSSGADKGPKHAYGKSLATGQSRTGRTTYNGYVRNGSGVDQRSDINDAVDTDSRRGIVTTTTDADVEMQNMGSGVEAGTIRKKTEVKIEVSDGNDGSSLEEEKRPHHRWNAM